MTHPVLETVLGPRPAPEHGLVDAHGHLWVAPAAGAAEGAPVLDDEDAIVGELAGFRAVGGALVVDCQPPACGRDLARLASISARSAIDVIASTGYHLPRYYPPGAWPWSAPETVVVETFVDELTAGVRVDGHAVRAGAIKAAYTGEPGDDCERLLACACEAAARTGAALVLHTEGGRGVERLADLLGTHGLEPERAIVCHVDKRPDSALHDDLAAAGFMLEYDTFLREQYEPDRNVWPLLVHMLERGHARSVACGLDLADASLWRFGGGAAGPAGLGTVVAQRLELLELAGEDVDRVLRANVVERLACAVRVEAGA